MFLNFIDNVTTGHKLQGCGVENLFVHNWHYMTNWSYIHVTCEDNKGTLCHKT